jgi:hypothetical protein
MLKLSDLSNFYCAAFLIRSDYSQVGMLHTLNADAGVAFKASFTG